MISENTYIYIYNNSTNVCFRISQSQQIIKISKIATQNFKIIAICLQNQNWHIWTHRLLYNFFNSKIRYFLQKNFIIPITTLIKMNTEQKLLTIRTTFQKEEREGYNVSKYTRSSAQSNDQIFNNHFIPLPLNPSQGNIFFILVPCVRYNH